MCLSNMKSTVSSENDTVYPRSTKEATDNKDPCRSGKMCAEISCPDGNRSVPKWVDRIEWPFATMADIFSCCWHSCTFVRHLMSLIAKYSSVAPESAFALCEAALFFVTVVNAENGWSGIVGIEYSDGTEKIFVGDIVVLEEEE